MGGFNLQELMSKAKSQYDNLQKKMQETVVEASSGGGTVTAKMDGRKQLLSLRIDPEAVKSGDVEMLQDLVLAAVNEAARKEDWHIPSRFMITQLQNYPHSYVQICRTYVPPDRRAEEAPGRRREKRAKPGFLHPARQRRRCRSPRHPRARR